MVKKEKKNKEEEKPEEDEATPKKDPVQKDEISKANGTEVAKILVKEDDELTFVVEQVKAVTPKRIVVSIPEGSDLLVSSVGMRLIAKHADEDKQSVVVVTSDAAGQNMARMAGLGVAATMSDVDENSWIDAESEQKSRLAVEEDESEVEGEGALINKDFMDNIEETERKISGIEETGQEDELETEIEDEASEPVLPMDLGRPRSEMKIGEEEKEGDEKSVVAPVAEVGKSSAPVREVKPVSDGDFTMNVDKGFKTAGGVGGMSAAVSGGAKADSPKGLVGRDFSAYNLEKAPGAASPDALPIASDSPSSGSDKKRGSILGKITGVFAKISFLAAKPATGMAKKNLKKLLIPAVVVLALIVVGGYWYLPEVVVSLEVESIAVEYEGEITASVTAEEIDEENVTIPARSEVEANNGSDSAAATGIASRGDKASGDVLFINKTGDEVTIAVGTALSNGGLSFILQADVTVPGCEDPPACDSAYSDHGLVMAEDIGEEYNVVSGTVFSVDITGIIAKSTEAFTGGTSEDYAVVSQADIDGLADEIKKKLFNESKTALEEALEGTKWVFVPESIKNELDGDVGSDVPAGSEQDSVNVDVKTKSTALYYDSEDLDELIKVLLMEDVGEDEFENVELSDNMEKEITVKSASVDDGTVVLSVKVSGFIMPLLDEDKIERDLYGKAWAEGVGYLKKVDYVSGGPDVDFYPEWFPEFARHMPSREGMITVNIENVVPEGEESEEDGSDEAAEGESTEE